MTQTYQYYNPEPNRTEQPYRGPQQKKTGRSLLKTIAFAIVFGLIAGLVFTGVSFTGHKLLGIGGASGEQVVSESNEKDSSKTDTAQSILQSTTSTSDANIADIAEGAMPSVVSITSMSIQEVQSFFGPQAQEAKSAGSGIILGENNDELLIATNNHVIAGSE